MPKINVKKPINFCNEDIYCYLHQKCNGYNKKTNCKKTEKNSSCNDNNDNTKKCYSDARIVFYTLGLGCVLSGQKTLRLTCCDKTDRNSNNIVITDDSTHETFNKYIHNIRQLITVFI
jgi:hypothetical protein